MTTVHHYTPGVLRSLLAEYGGDAYAEQASVTISRWAADGKGAAIYRNEDMGHPELGRLNVVSYGTPTAQLETASPPQRLPDIGGQINWRYCLLGICPPEREETK